jgi:hypothetical protein
MIVSSPAMPICLFGTFHFFIKVKSYPESGFTPFSFCGYRSLIAKLTVLANSLMAFNLSRSSFFHQRICDFFPPCYKIRTHRDIQRVKMVVFFVGEESSVWELIPETANDRASKRERGVCSSLDPCSLSGGRSWNLSGRQDFHISSILERKPNTC